MSAVAETKSGTRLDWAGLLLLAVSAAYLLTWWNRYLSPTVGFELAFAAQAARDQLPYRDYYFPVQPGWVLAAIGGTALFGPKLIGFWFAGVVLRLLGVWCVYRWLTRLCPPRWAAFVTAVGFFVSCGDIADFPAWYNYLTFVFALMGGFFAAKAVEYTEGRGLVWTVLAGLFLAANLLTKQTSGVLAGFATMAATAVALYARHGLGRSLRSTLVLGTTAALPCLATARWMMQHGLWADYIDQVWVSGPASKGGGGGALLRIFTETCASDNLFMAAVLALSVGALGGLLWDACRRAGDERTRQMRMVRILALLGLEALLLVWLSRPGSFDARTPALAAANLGQFGSLVLAVAALAAVWRGAREEATLHQGMFGAVGFAAAFAMSLSWPNFEVMAWPGLALVMAMVSRLSLARSEQLWMRPCLLAAGLLLVLVSVQRKYNFPATWGLWSEPPVASGTVEPRTPGLVGFRLSPQSAEFFDEVTRLIQEHTSPADPILVYPHMPILYGLADRPLATSSYMHWFDVCPDYLAVADAERLRRTPPRLMVVMELSPLVYTANEAAFRKGRTCGQRQIQAVLDELLPEYELLGNFSSPGYGVPIGVWLRRGE